MLEDLNDLSGPLFESAGNEVVATETLGGHLGTDEQPQHALLSDSVEHETQGRTTTVKPDGNHDAYLIVTDERVLVILGDQPETVEIEFDLRSISRCNLKSGFLSTTFIVGHSDESVRFSPTDGNPERVSEYVQLVSEVYTEVGSAIQSAEGFTEEMETKLRQAKTTGEIVDVTRLRLRVRSQLSEARHLATREDGVPTDKLLERIEERKAEFHQRYVDAWVERAETAIQTAEEAAEDGDFETVCSAYRTANEAVETLEDALEDFEDPPDEAPATLERLADRTDDIATRYVEATQAAYETATDATDPETAATNWLETYRRLSSARAANWTDLDGSSELPLGEIESVASETVTALDRHAEDLEASGEAAIDDDADRAREHFQAAIERIQQAKTVATEATSIDVDYDARLDDLQEQIEVTEWQWGTG